MFGAILGPPKTETVAERRDRKAKQKRVSQTSSGSSTSGDSYIFDLNSFKKLTADGLLNRRSRRGWGLDSGDAVKENSDASITSSTKRTTAHYEESFHEMPTDGILRLSDDLEAEVEEYVDSPPYETKDGTYSSIRKNKK